MSYPYQYVPMDYSNPTTPRVYTWEVDQDPLQLQHPAQPQQIFHEQQQQAQHQQLRGNQHQQPEQQQQPPQPQQQSVVPAYEPPPTIQLQERKPPSLFRFDNITEEHFIQAAREGDESSSRRRATSRPPPTPRGATVSPGGSSSTGAGAGVGPQRIPHTRPTPGTHPYHRLSGSGPGARARRESEMSHQSAPATPLAGPSALHASGTATQCPAAHTWRESLMRQPDEAASATSPEVRTPTPRTPAQELREQLDAIAPRRYTIRTDVHFDVDSGVMTVMLELPGVKKADVRLSLSQCPLSRVRQLTVAGRSRAPLAAGGHTVQERKFGVFARTIVVPPETKADDVVAVMEDGILTLRIPSGPPAESEQPQDIAIQ